MSQSKENSFIDEYDPFPHNIGFFDLSLTLSASNGQIKSIPPPSFILESDELHLLCDRVRGNFSLNIDQNLKLLKKEKNPNGTLIDLWEFIGTCEAQKTTNLRSAHKEKYPSDLFIGIRSLLNLEKELQSPSKVPSILNIAVFESAERKFVMKSLGWSDFDIFNREEPDAPTNHFANELNCSKKAAQYVFGLNFLKAVDFLGKICKKEGTLYESEVQCLKSLLNGFASVFELVLKDQEIKSHFIINCNVEGSMDYMNELVFSSERNEDATGKFFAEFSRTKNKKQKIEMINQYLFFLRTLAKKCCFENPYFSLISRFLSQELFTDLEGLLRNNCISFYDRICIFCRFVDSQRFLSIIASALQNPSLEYIILFGRDVDQRKESISLNIIKQYLDMSGDIQNASLLAFFLKFLSHKQIDLGATPQIWLQSYRDLLNKLQLYYERCRLDQSIQDFQKSRSIHLLTEVQDSSSIAQKCYYCSSSLSHASNSGVYKKGYATLSRCDKIRIFNCPECLKPLCNCAICLLPVGIFNPYLEEQKKKSSLKKDDPYADIEILNIEEAIVWCQSCRHGGHFKHMEEWFREEGECPVTDCPCECGNLM